MTMLLGRNRATRNAFLLPEFLILLTIVCILGIALVSLIRGTDQQDRIFAVDHNLSKLRAQLRQYSAEHEGRFPSRLEDLISVSNIRGASRRGREPSTAFPLGPYLQALPENTLSRAVGPARSAVRLIANHPPGAGDVTPHGQGGWLYNPRTGGVWIDHTDRFNR